MPYKLRKAPNKELYWVVTTETGKKHSKKPLPYKTAEAQRRALYASMTGGNGDNITRRTNPLHYVPPPPAPPVAPVVPRRVIGRTQLQHVEQPTLPQERASFAVNTSHPRAEIAAMSVDAVCNPFGVCTIQGGGEKLPTLEKQGSAYAIVYKGQTLSRFARKQDALEELNTYTDKGKLARADEQLAHRRRATFGHSSDEGYDAELAQLRGGGIHDTLRSSWLPSLRTVRDKRGTLIMLFSSLSYKEQDELNELTQRLVGIPFFQAIDKRYDLERIIQDIVKPPERLAAPVAAPPAPRHVAPQVQVQNPLQNPIRQVESVEQLFVPPVLSAPLRSEAQEFVPQLSRHAEVFVPASERALLPTGLLEGGKLFGGGGWSNAIVLEYERLATADVLAEAFVNSSLNAIRARALRDIAYVSDFMPSGVHRDLTPDEVMTGVYRVAPRYRNNTFNNKEQITKQAIREMRDLINRFRVDRRDAPRPAPFQHQGPSLPPGRPLTIETFYDAKNEECPICLEDLGQLEVRGIPLYLGPCGHAMCQSEYDEMPSVVSSGPRTGEKRCPNCRRQPYGGKLKFVKKYLKGRGMPATKGNVKSVMDAMDAEGVVFE